ncbi:COP9 signalosome complex subunit 6-like protein [Endogone sp. FLAS-F59071]|nr:COP9 signalosome complex subunit 6-like protein [Endogone sp. FLAS-F59071]|eukprot:RUS21155.1 COP9 signalosome complex subunit 6-like protein [Endogone sp. FLAS-F59071]
MSSSMDLTADTDTPGTSQPVVSTAQNISGLSVSLHPLVLLNISDHFTRVRLQTQNPNPQVIGALLGIQTGRDVEIFNSFELLFHLDTGAVVIDMEYFKDKQDQFKLVFPQYDFLGWYSMGAQPTLAEIDIHKQFLENNESPLFLQLDPASLHKDDRSKSLPVSLYESTIEVIGGQPQTLFIRSQYKIETGEAERIAVDHVSKPSVSTTTGGGAESSTLIAHLNTQRNAINMLHTRVAVLHQYLLDVNAGVVPKDHDVLRQIASLCNRLPAIDSAEFREEFFTEYNDVLLTSYLATITKGVNGMNELVDKFNVATNGTGRRTRGMGLLI